MIIKGASRANPAQLTRHLLRTDTNDKVTVLENAHPSGDLGGALRDWQALASLTRGKKGLYHANIDPDARYELTPEQWTRAADVLEEELGLKGQPRVLVQHEKLGRRHIHVVWQRTDEGRGVLISDGHNYKAHERASARLEDEFGHERTPGKHSKRDRSKGLPAPGNLSRAFNHAEWQQAERTGEDPRARKASITELWQTSDSGDAFRAGLAALGYVLARGDRRAFVIVDTHAEVYSLSRCIDGARTKDIRDRLSEIDPASIPAVEHARAFQREKAGQPREKTAQERDEGRDRPSPAPEAENVSQAPSGPAGHGFGDGLAADFLVAAEPPGAPPLTAPFSEAAQVPLPAFQRIALERTEKRLAALDQALKERQSAERADFGRQCTSDFADAFGFPESETQQRVLAIEDSRFAPAQMLEAERALSPSEREIRQAVLAELRQRHARALQELRDRQEAERADLARRRDEELERLERRFELERKRDAEAERARIERKEMLERRRLEQGRGRDDDDTGHTR